MQDGVAGLLGEDVGIRWRRVRGTQAVRVQEKNGNVGGFDDGAEDPVGGVGEELRAGFEVYG